MINTEQISSTRMLEDSENVSDGGISDSIKLPDYQLIERIGAGGYGEVWRATGPGGLPKAVKVLYGERSGKHAEAEFKALERMRDLRHPFLLSIERIEVIDARLIVVTELADGNLQERFNEYRGNGSPGIPRDELLGYLRDAADALDFMTEQHGLQHLDIKPDNLLLQGNHAKVGDFGLAKNLDATNVSVVNGFTPMYAAPELFEGRPGRATDQYSLAIVYQTMLTGASPFNGRTAAQLTAQHLRSQPDLTNLQPIDRPVIARALSKNTNSRFRNCRELVDELSRRKHSRASNRAFVTAAPAADLNRTALVDSSADTGDASVSEQASSPIHFKTVPTTADRIRPTVIIGVGGLAGHVLAQTRGLVGEFSEEANISFLQVDTDRSALHSLVAEGGPSSIKSDETLAIPLRSSNDYRSASNLNLSWMSRRWLFNIPRSGKVEGIRPLGRLAMCDHQISLKQRLTDVLTTAANSQTGAESDGMDVYVVASTTGGTGSGAVADMGLMVKSVLSTESISNVSVNGLLLHATGFTRNVTDVQDANTVCTLQELRHLLTPGLGTPRGFDDSSKTTDLTPFDHTYLVHFGDASNDARMSRRVLDVAKYVFECVTSDARLDFAAWRTPEEHALDNPTQLRLLGLSSQDAESLRTASKESGRLVAQLYGRWCSPTSEMSGTEATQLPALLTDTQTLMVDLNLTASTLPQQVVGLLRGQTGKDVEACAERAFQKLESAQAMETMIRQQVVDSLSAELANPLDSGNATIMSVVSEVQKNVAGSTKKSTTAITDHLADLLDSPYRLNAAAVAADHVATTLQETADACDGLQREIATMLTELVQQQPAESGFSGTVEGGATENIRAFCKQYCALLAYQAIYHCFIEHVKNVRHSVNEWNARLRQLKQELKLESETILAAATANADDIPAPVLDAFDQQLRIDNTRLLRCSTKQLADIKSLTIQICTAANQFLVKASSVLQDGPSQTHASERAFPQNAWPEFKGIGGRRRVLAMLPEGVGSDQWEKTLRDEFGDCVGSRSSLGQCVSVVCEVDSVPVESVLSRLTHNNPHIADVASRIHTRIDVDW